MSPITKIITTPTKHSDAQPLVEMKNNCHKIGIKNQRMHCKTAY